MGRFLHRMCQARERKFNRPVHEMEGDDSLLPGFDVPGCNNVDLYEELSILKSEEKAT